MRGLILVGGTALFGLAWLATGGGAYCGRAAEAWVTPATVGPQAQATAIRDRGRRLRWVSGQPVLHPVADATHPIVSIKDPSVVRYDGRWHVIATTADVNASWSMVYLSFSDWSEAAAAKPYYMDQNPNLTGYHCAPQVFYFRPHKKWYLVFQSQHPQYSTNDDISQPGNWTRPQNFFAGKPASVIGTWLDYWVICDEMSAYLFFTDNTGRFYRSETALADFPLGFSVPVVAMQDADQWKLFEASCTYRLEGQNRYLTLVEAIGPGWRRFFRAFTAESLDGAWTPVLEANSWELPFAGSANVRFEGEAWTTSISHGEMLRLECDEMMSVDPFRMEFLYQGFDPARDTPNYSQLPWELAILRRARHYESTPPPRVHPRLQ